MSLSNRDNATVIRGTSFLVRIYFRQNASWQGTIQWLDGKKTVAFRSDVELAMLLMQAAKEDNDGTYQAPSWDDKQEVS